MEGHASVEDLIEEADGFAEVFPEHKHMIVKILQVGGWVRFWVSPAVLGPSSSPPHLSVFALPLLAL